MDPDEYSFPPTLEEVCEIVIGSIACFMVMVLVFSLLV